MCVCGGGGGWFCAEGSLGLEGYGLGNKKGKLERGLWWSYWKCVGLGDGGKERLGVRMRLCVCGFGFSLLLGLGVKQCGCWEGALMGFCAMGWQV